MDSLGSPPASSAARQASGLGLCPHLCHGAMVAAVLSQCTVRWHAQTDPALDPGAKATPEPSNTQPHYTAGAARPQHWLETQVGSSASGVSGSDYA